VNISLIEDYAYHLKIDLRMAVFSVRAFMKPFRTTVRRAFNRGVLVFVGKSLALFISLIKRVHTG
jgi:hypothetical protein